MVARRFVLGRQDTRNSTDERGVSQKTKAAPSASLAEVLLRAVQLIIEVGLQVMRVQIHALALCHVVS